MFAEISVSLKAFAYGYYKHQAIIQTKRPNVLRLVSWLVAGGYSCHLLRLSIVGVGVWLFCSCCTLACRVCGWCFSKPTLHACLLAFTFCQVVVACCWCFFQAPGFASRSLVVGCVDLAVRFLLGLCLVPLQASPSCFVPLADWCFSY